MILIITSRLVSSAIASNADARKKKGTGSPAFHVASLSRSNVECAAAAAMVNAPTPSTCVQVCVVLCVCGVVYVEVFVVVWCMHSIEYPR